MNKTEFAALPPDLQRDVRCAVAIGWPLTHIRKTAYGIEVFEKRFAFYPWRRFNPTQTREIWAGLLEWVCYAGLNLEVPFAKGVNNVGSGIVAAFIRRDPLGHLGRSGL